MDKLLNLWQLNPYNVIIDAMTTLSMQKVTQKWKNDPQRNPSNINNDQTKNDPAKKDDGKVLLHVGSTATEHTEGTETDGDNATHGDNDNYRTIRAWLEGWFSIGL